MPIGEFGGAPPLVAEGSPALTTPMYWMYEMAHASLNPARAVTDATKLLFQNPLNDWAPTETNSEKAETSSCPRIAIATPQTRTNHRHLKTHRPPVQVERRPTGPPNQVQQRPDRSTDS